MKMFLDSAKTDEIKHALEVWNIDGVTTNPRHVRAAGQPFRKTLKQIAALVEGTDKPVSVEVDPHLAEHDQIVAAARELAALCPNFVIKVAASEAGFRAIRTLGEARIRTNATLVFTTTQAWHAARAGAVFVSPFLGWKEAHGDDTENLIAEIRSMLDYGGYQTEILAAAIRNSRQIGLAAALGADAVTAGFDVYGDSFRNPYTDMGNDVFGAAWNETPEE